jgi:hypothetical protein
MTDKRQQARYCDAADCYETRHLAMDWINPCTFRGRTMRLGRKARIMAGHYGTAEA